MKKIEIIGLLQDRKKIIERLQRRGIVEIIDFNEDGFSKLDTRNSISQFEKNMNSAISARNILMKRFPKKKGLFESFKGKEEFEKHEFGKKATRRDEIVKICHEIISNDQKIAECKAANVKTEVLIDNLRPWINLSVPLNFKGTNSTRCFIGSISNEHTAEQIKDMILEIEGVPESIDIDIISSFKEITNIAVLCYAADNKVVYDALRKIGFIEIGERSSLKPIEQIEEYKKDIQKNNETVEKCLSNIEKFTGNIGDIEFLIDYMNIRKEKYEALNELAMTKSTFILNGYVPLKYADKLVKELENRFDAAVTIYDLSEDEEAPILLSNGKFSEPVEGITEMYALPNKRDIDPTSVMSFFYYFFFGMMLSDAGYGLVMVIGCAIALKKLHFSEKMRKAVTMFMYCGVSTIIWGALFGSWFGDIVQVVGQQFFGVEIGSLALWFEPLDDPMTLLLYCFAFGIVHLFVGVAVNFRILWKEGKKWDAIWDTVPIYLTILGVAPIAAGILTEVPAILSQIGGYMAIAGVVLIVLTQGRSSKTILGRLGGGLYGLYNTATGYLSDILSYSRLLALGLATGSIAGVINLIGTMPDNLVVKAVMLIVVFIVGHTLNLAVNLLGAYVHTDRLQFVELFSKFYEGGGRAFKPLTVHSKYIKFKEEQINE